MVHCYSLDVGTALILALASAAWCAEPEASLTAVGDIRLDGPIATIAREAGGKYPSAEIVELLKADVVFGNLECPITTRGEKLDKTWNFRAPPRSLALLKRAGFDLLNIANNHVWD